MSVTEKFSRLRKTRWASVYGRPTSYNGVPSRPAGEPYQPNGGGTPTCQTPGYAGALLSQQGYYPPPAERTAAAPPDLSLDCAPSPGPPGQTIFMKHAERHWA